MQLFLLSRTSIRDWIRAAEADHGLFVTGRRLANGQPLLVDALLAGAFLVACTVWLAVSPFAGLTAGLLQAALVIPLAWRRSYPSPVFVVVAFVGLVQLLVGPPLLADAALLAALYTVAAHDSRHRALAAAGILEIGAILAAIQWNPAHSIPRSMVFLTATVVAALCLGWTVRSGSEYLAWLAERSRRLEVERDQQASIAAAQERTRIAREMHDIVAHSLSVVVTLVDAASLVSRSDPARAEDAMRHAAEVGRQALGDMRTMIGVLRTDSASADLVPQPRLSDLDGLLSRVRATGLAVQLDIAGEAFVVGGAAELTIYRIVQESLTNTMKHASASGARVEIRYDRPEVVVTVTDDGRIAATNGWSPSDFAAAASPANPASLSTGAGGHGLAGMRERAAIHRGAIEAGPTTHGGWCVRATLRPDTVGSSR
jgi:signal transduction histidine kinase